MVRVRAVLSGDSIWGHALRAVLARLDHCEAALESAPVSSGGDPEVRIADGISYDPGYEVLTIDGFRYARELFRGLTGGIPLNQYFKVIRREDGMITIQTEPNAGVDV